MIFSLGSHLVPPPPGSLRPIQPAVCPGTPGFPSKGLLQEEGRPEGPPVLHFVFVKTMVPAPICAENRDETVHRRGMLAATAEMRGLIIGALFEDKPDARFAAHPGASVFPRVHGYSSLAVKSS